MILADKKNNAGKQKQYWQTKNICRQNRFIKFSKNFQKLKISENNGEKEEN